MSYAQSLLVGLPLAGFLLNGLAGNRLGKRFVSIVGCGLPIVAFGVALQCLADLTARGGTPLVETAYAWTVIGGRSFEIAFYFDRLTAVMASIIKAGVLFGAVRLFGAANVTGPVVDLLALLPLLSIVWGNLAAMRQQSFRRMDSSTKIIAGAGLTDRDRKSRWPARFDFAQSASGLLLVLFMMCVRSNCHCRHRSRSSAAR